MVGVKRLGGGRGQWGDGVKGLGSRVKGWRCMGLRDGVVGVKGWWSQGLGRSRGWWGSKGGVVGNKGWVVGV